MMTGRGLILANMAARHKRMLARIPRADIQARVWLIRWLRAQAARELADYERRRRKAYRDTSRSWALAGGQAVAHLPKKAPPLRVIPGGQVPSPSIRPARPRHTTEKYFR